MSTKWFANEHRWKSTPKSRGIGRPHRHGRPDAILRNPIPRRAAMQKKMAVMLFLNSWKYMTWMQHTPTHREHLHAIHVALCCLHRTRIISFRICFVTFSEQVQIMITLTLSLFFCRVFNCAFVWTLIYCLKSCSRFIYWLAE